jgi:trigger factor
MEAVVEPLEGNKVKLTVRVGEQEFERDIDAAFRRISREVRVPGFRPGKAPRRILEARFGKESGRTKALKEALPGYYSQAVRQHAVDVVAAPQIDIISGEDAGPVSFDAVVEVRPQLKLAGYTGLRVVIPSPVVTEEEVQAQIDRLRGNFGELTAVERPARDGDFLTLDLQATRGGEPVSGMTTDDFLYELGSASVLPELDEKLQGAKVGDILGFDADVPEATNFRVLVKDVREKLLPDLTDEWAGEASEFDTVDELRADITSRVGLVKRMQAAAALRNAVLDAVVELVDSDPPPSLVDAEIHQRVNDLGRRLEAQGVTIAQYLEVAGQSPEDLVESMRPGAVSAVKADLALRAVADAEHFDPTAEELDAEIERLAGSHKVSPGELKRSLDRADQMPAVRSEWKKSKALEWLIEHVEIVDAQGHPVDRALLEPAETNPEPDQGSAQVTAGTDPSGAPPAQQDTQPDPKDRQDMQDTETGEP